ncbi:MAG: hypothetical protein ACP5E3_14180 [Bacteroidales bacterium]
MNNLYGQPYSKIEDTDVIEEQQVVLQQKFPHYFEGLIIDSLYIINSKLSKLSYVKDDVYHEAIINRDVDDLMIVAIAAELPREGVPEVILNALKDSDYGESEVLNFYYVTIPYQEDFYAFDIAENGGFDRVFFNDLGVLQADPY